MRAATSIGAVGSHNAGALLLVAASIGNAHESKNLASESGMKRLRNA